MSKRNIILTVIVFMKIVHHAQDTLTSPADSAALYEMNADDLLQDESDGQDVSPLLQSSRDAFMQFSSYLFTYGRFRVRGYDGSRQTLMINGADMTNLATGSGMWEVVSGLNDVTRFSESRVGIVPCRQGLPGAGGFTSVEAQAGSARRGVRVTVTGSTRIFNSRIMCLWNSGMTPEGWAFSVCISNRTGRWLEIPGTSFFSSAMYLSATRKFKKKHLLSLSLFGSISARTPVSAETAETYSLAGATTYNSQWGYQHGKERSASNREIFQPLAMMMHSWERSARFRFQTVLYGTTGRSRRRSLNWADAPDPRPAYYKNLPGYYEEDGDHARAGLLRALWEDPLYRQLNFDRMTSMNRANLFALPGETGVTGQTRARYILQDAVEIHSAAGLGITVNNRSGRWFFSEGLQLKISRSERYAEIADLLGADFWLDYDQFAEGNDPASRQNDLFHPDEKNREGDRIGYDHSILMNRYSLWMQAERNGRKTDLFARLALTRQHFRRTGNVANGKFPEQSIGAGASHNFQGFHAGAGITHRLSGRHFITAALQFLKQPPVLSSVYVSPGTRDRSIENIDGEIGYGAEVSYIIKRPKFRSRLTIFQTYVHEAPGVRTYWHDILGTNVNLIMRNVQSRQEGAEFSVDINPGGTHQVQWASGWVANIFANRPLLDVWHDGKDMPVYTGRTTYLKNYHKGTGPEFACGAGYRYNARRRWFISVNICYFDGIYIQPNADRRTAEALSNYLSNEMAAIRAITVQEKADGYFLAGFSAGASLRLRKKYFMNASLSVNNLLNNTSAVITGFEQPRWDPMHLSRFDNKYYHLSPLSVLLNVSVSFQ